MIQSPHGSYPRRFIPCVAWPLCSKSIEYSGTINYFVERGMETRPNPFVRTNVIDLWRKSRLSRRVSFTFININLSVLILMGFSKRCTSPFLSLMFHPRILRQSCWSTTWTRTLETWTLLLYRFADILNISSAIHSISPNIYFAVFNSSQLFDLEHASRCIKRP